MPDVKTPEQLATEKAEKLAAERKNINVTGTTPVEKTVEELAAETAGEETEIEETEETEETNEELTEEEKTALAASEQTKSVEKLQRTIDRLQKRIDKTTGSNKDLQRQLADTEKKLTAKQAEGEVVLTADDVNKEAERLANEKFVAKEFTAACNRLADGGAKIDKKFDDKVKVMAEDIGPIPSQMIGILDDLDNGPEVLTHLVNNIDEAEEIYSLSLARMTLRLAKLSTTLSDEAKEKKKKPISKVPAPNEPVGGGGSKTPVDLNAALAGSNGVVDKTRMENFARMRARQIEERRQARQR